MLYLILDAVGNIIGDVPTAADYPDPMPAGCRQVAVPTPAGPSAWNHNLEVFESVVTPAPTPDGVPRLTVQQFRDRWTWSEQVAFELAAETDAEMRVIDKQVDARMGRIEDGCGIDPTSGTMAYLGSLVVAYAQRGAPIITADRMLCVRRPVGAYHGEWGAKPDALLPPGKGGPPL